MRQRIHITIAADQVQIAWARAGAGPVLVKAANWLTHLRHDLDSPVWRHWIGFVAGHFDFIRHDERGCGLSRVHWPGACSPPASAWCSCQPS